MNGMTFHQLLQDHDIVIPVIQRDYAQGRSDERRVREGFVAALKEALTENRTLMLDFIYGEVEGGVFLPFDGQQRLTTLFLLHWYAAAREESRDMRRDEFSALLRRFRYEVRESSQNFCRELAEHADILRQNGSEMPSFLITDACWFSPAWNHDATVTGMLTMLDAIHASFFDVPCLMEHLAAKDCPVRFHFARLSELGNSADDIFITMNARGKQLTAWEHFKAQFLPWLRETYPDRADDIARKLDNDWLDVFWSGFPARKNGENPAEATDKRLALFFDFAARMLLPGPEITKGDLFSRVSAALSPDRQRLCAACDNLELVVRMLDTLHELILPEGKGIAPFFVELFSGASGDALPVPGKISLFNHGTVDTNLLRLCCEGTLSSSDELMLFGRLMAAALRIPPDKEKRRLRILRNLLEYPFQDDGENPRLRRLLALHDLLACETVSDENGFNPWQVQEEKAKLALRQAHEDDAALQDALDYLEDHPLLRGRIAVFSRADQEENAPLVFEREGVVRGAHFLRLAFGSRRISYDMLLRCLLSFGEYEPPRSDFRPGCDGSLQNLRQFLCPSPESTAGKEHFLLLRRALESLSQEGRNAATTEELENLLSHAAKRWLNDREERHELTWRWYFARYAAMRPDFCAAELPRSEQGKYAYVRGVNPYKTFEWMQLEKKTCGGRHWNPFLRTVCARAREEGAKEPVWDETASPCRLLLPGGLCLTMNECAWILSPADDGKKTSAENGQAILERLRALYSELDKEGYLPVPGKDSEEGVDYRRIQGHQSRKYDTTDRIALILPVVKALSDME